jgi:hypothetical protein
MRFIINSLSTCRKWRTLRLSSPLKRYVSRHKNIKQKKEVIIADYES